MLTEQNWQSTYNHHIDTRCCPSCHQHTVLTWWQPGLLRDQPGSHQMHCQNPGCALHEVTRSETIYFPQTTEQQAYHDNWLKLWQVKAEINR